MTCINNAFGSSAAWTGTTNNLFASGQEFSPYGDFCPAPAGDALAYSWNFRADQPNQFEQIFGSNYNGSIFSHQPGSNQYNGNGYGYNCQTCFS